MGASLHRRPSRLKAMVASEKTRTLELKRLSALIATVEQLLRPSNSKTSGTVEVDCFDPDDVGGQASQMECCRSGGDSAKAPVAPGSGLTPSISLPRAPSYSVSRRRLSTTEDAVVVPFDDDDGTGVL